MLKFPQYLCRNNNYSIRNTCRYIGYPTALRTFSTSNLKYFEIFDLNPKFKIDLTALRKKFLALQVIHHPDKSSDTGKSTEINKAYETLKNPLLRARYLAGKISIQLSPEFLMFVYEIQDDIQEGINVDKIKVDLERLINESITNLEELDEGRDHSGFQEETAKLGYYYNIKNLLNSK